MERNEERLDILFNILKNTDNFEIRKKTLTAICNLTENNYEKNVKREDDHIVVNSDKGFYSLAKITNTLNKHYGLNVDIKQISNKIKELGLKNSEFSVKVVGFKSLRYKPCVVEIIFEELKDNC